MPAIGRLVRMPVVSKIPNAEYRVLGTLPLPENYVPFTYPVDEPMSWTGAMDVSPRDFVTIVDFRPEQACGHGCYVITHTLVEHLKNIRGWHGLVQPMPLEEYFLQPRRQRITELGTRITQGSYTFPDPIDQSLFNLGELARQDSDRIAREFLISPIRFERETTTGPQPGARTLQALERLVEGAIRSAPATREEQQQTLNRQMDRLFHRLVERVIADPSDQPAQSALAGFLRVVGPHFGQQAVQGDGQQLSNVDALPTDTMTGEPEYDPRSEMDSFMRDEPVSLRVLAEFKKLRETGRSPRAYLDRASYATMLDEKEYKDYAGELATSTWRLGERDLSNDLEEFAISNGRQRHTPMCVHDHCVCEDALTAAVAAQEEEHDGS